MSGKASSISRYYPQLLIVAGVVFALGALHLHNIYNSQPKKKQKPLRRRNATRQRNRNRSIGGSDAQNAATAEALARLDGNSGHDGTDGLAIDGISLPNDEALTTMLNNAGVAARGNREDGNDSDFSFGNDGREIQEPQNIMHLLYLIAEDQAKQNGYVHRAVTCNICQINPIRGVRYRCSNCIDFDLCESCEAQDAHPKTHLFYKVRIPAPFLGNPRKIQAPVYPGRPSIMAINVPAETLIRFGKETGMDQPDIEALYEQFKCIAATEFPGDPNGLGGGIDRATFDKCFVPNNSLRPPPPNLIYDRMFAFYDSDGNGLIGFEEFIKGLAIKSKKSETTANIAEKHRRIFKAYDLDGDGYIERKDVLRMFRAYYALQKDLMKDLVGGMDDDVMESSQSQNVINGSQPISAAFSTAINGNDEVRRVKSAHEEMNDVARDALRPDSDETGRRRETVEEAVQQHRRDQSRDRMTRRTQRQEERMRRRLRESAGIPDTADLETYTLLRDTDRLIDRLNRDDRDSSDRADDAIIDATLASLAETTETEAEGDVVVGGEISTDFMDDIINVINDIQPDSTDHEGGDQQETDGNDGDDTEDDTEEQEDSSQDVHEEQEEETEDHIPDTSSDSAPLNSSPPHREPVIASSVTPPVAPQLPELELEPYTFYPTEDWTAEINMKGDTPRKPAEDELKLYYLEDYYNSDDEDTESDYANDGWVMRKRPTTTHGLEKEEDVGREILSQVIEQGINEMLDMLFLNKEKDGLEVLRDGSKNKTKPESSSEENKENIDSSTDTKAAEPSDPFSIPSLSDEEEWPVLPSRTTSIVSDPKLSPPVDPLARLKKEVNTRGGPGRISESEFINIMQGDTGRKLAFMNAWISMGSF